MSSSSTVPTSLSMSPFEVGLLVLLSIVWGGSFVFAAVALEALPPLTVVLVRVGLGAITIMVISWMLGKRLPRDPGRWFQLFVMSILNNVIPFSLIVWGQTHITAGLASILNGTTPIFALLVAHVLTADERLSVNKTVGVVLGFLGVAVLVGPAAVAGETSIIGQFAILGAACSYGFAATWGKRLSGMDPMVVATGQLICSTVIMIPVAGLLERPWMLNMPGGEVIASLIGLAVFSTALAYIMFFRILKGAGAINVSLVTLLIPVSAIAMGIFWLGEPVVLRQIAGAVVIGLALLVVDGRLFRGRVQS